MTWQNSLEWLLEVDHDNPGVRYFALAELLDRPADDAELLAAHQAVMTSGPVPIILSHQNPEGYWIEGGAGYYPKYRGTVWQVIFLAQLGADGADPRVRAACAYLLEQSPSRFGGFSADGRAVCAVGISQSKRSSFNSLWRLQNGRIPMTSTSAGVLIDTKCRNHDVVKAQTGQSVRTNRSS